MLLRLTALAGELGFEPRQTESESVVLPLHHSPRIYKRIQYVIRFCLAIACDGIRQIPAECGAVLLARSRPWQAAAMPLSEKRLHAIPRRLPVNCSHSRISTPMWNGGGQRRNVRVCIADDRNSAAD